MTHIYFSEWKDRCYLARPAEHDTTVDYFRYVLRDGDAPGATQPDNSHGDSRCVERALYGLYLAACYEYYVAKGHQDFAVQVSVEMGEVIGEIEQRRDRVYIDRGVRVYEGARRSRERRKHDEYVICEVYDEVLPQCRYKKEAYTIVCQRVNTHPHPDYVKKIIYKRARNP